MTHMTVKEKAEKLYKSVGSFIISCVGNDGYPLMKAVVPGKHRISLKEIYFCTNTSSKFAQELSRTTKASVYFYSKLLIWKGVCLREIWRLFQTGKSKCNIGKINLKMHILKNPRPTLIFAC